MSDEKPSGMRGWSRGAVLTVAVVTAVGTAAIAALLVNIMERKGEAQNSFFRVVELTDDTDRSRDLGKELSAAIRRLPADRGSAADALRRKRGHAAVPHRSRPALHRGAIAPGRRSPAEDDVGGLRVCHGFPQEARSRVHARGSDLHRARAELQAAGHLHPLSRVGLRALQEGRERRLDQGLRALQPDAVCRGAQGLHASDRVHRLSRAGHDGVARDPAGFYRRDSGLESERGREGLRREYDGDPAGDARLRLRSVSRRVLLQGPGEAAHLSVGQGPEGGPNLQSTTASRASPTGRTPRPERPRSRPSIPSSKCGTRASTRAPG